MNDSVIHITIGKDTLAQLPAKQYEGEIIVVDNEELAQKAVDELFKETEIGFDTETRPSFRKGQTFKVALLQLSTRNCCYLFRINKIGITPGLRKLLTDKSISKVGLSIHDDFCALRRSCNIDFQGFIDLQSFVKKFGIDDSSLQKIYAIIFKERISKGQRLTNWEADTLTQAQQAYAALDAWACLNIFDRLRSGNFKPEESEFKLNTHEKI